MHAKRTVVDVVLFFLGLVLVLVVEVKRAVEGRRSIGVCGLLDQLVIFIVRTPSIRLIVPLNIQEGEGWSISAIGGVDDVALEEGVIRHEVIAAVVAVSVEFNRFEHMFKAIGSGSVSNNINRAVARILGIVLNEMILTSTIGALRYGNQWSSEISQRITSDKIVHVEIAASPAVHLLGIKCPILAFEDCGAVHPGSADMLLVMDAFVPLLLLMHAGCVNRDPSLVAILVRTDCSFVEKRVPLGPVFSAVSNSVIPGVLDDETTNMTLSTLTWDSSFNSHLIVPANKDHSMTTTHDVFTIGVEDTLVGVTGKDYLSAATIRRLGARVGTSLALFVTIFTRVGVVTWHDGSALQNDVREGQRELLTVKKTLDAINRVSALDTLHAEGERVSLHSIIESRANKLDVTSLRLVGAKCVWKNILLDTVLHVVDPLGLTIFSTVIWWSTKAVDIVGVLRAVLDEAEAIGLLTEFNVFVLLKETFCKTVTSVGSLKDAHGREDVASSTMSLVLHRSTNVSRDNIRLGERTSQSHTFPLLVRQMRTTADEDSTKGNSDNKRDKTHNGSHKCHCANASRCLMSRTTNKR